MKKGKSVKYITIAVVLLLSLLFVAKFSGPAILKFYIESGIGTCSKIPILCMKPQEQINQPQLNKEYIRELLLYRFPKMTVFLPKGFATVHEKIKKVYYKRRRKDTGAIIYLLYEEPGFFVNLYPDVKKQGVLDNYEFIRRTMYASINEIKGLTDAFFVIMKGIFIPDLSEQTDVKMAQVTIGEKRGFINYNLGKKDSYFDCNVLTKEGDFFKIYIKDRGATLDLNKVLTIISTIERVS